MNISASSTPGPATPGGELQQISPGAWPTEQGGQIEASSKEAPISSSTSKPKKGSFPAKPGRQKVKA